MEGGDSKLVGDNISSPGIKCSAAQIDIVLCTNLCPSINAIHCQNVIWTRMGGSATTMGQGQSRDPTATCTKRLEGRAKLVSTPRGERTEWFGRGRLRCCRGSSRRLESRSIIEVRIEMFGSFSHQLKIRITILKFAFAFSYSASGQRHEYLYTM